MPADYSVSGTTARGAPAPLRFIDFSIRAWREGSYLQVIAHSTPAGGMRHPVAVKLGEFAAEDYRVPVDAPLAKGADAGRRLARLLLPNEVCTQLRREALPVARHPEATDAHRLPH